MDWMPQAIRDGIIVVLIISGPLVLAAAGIGLIIGILQAATQVQEQTIGSAMKIIGIFALLIIGGFWMYQYLNQYTSKTLSTAFTFVPHRTQKVIPRGVRTERKFDLEERFNPPLKVEPPEQIGNDIPGSVLPTQTYLGKPSIPQSPPSSSTILPPPALMQNLPLVKSNVPLSDFQEPIPLPNSAMGRSDDEYLPPVNLVPGSPSNLNSMDLSPWQEEISLEENNNFNMSGVENNNEEPVSTWLEE